jgi:hypothetical protein
MAILDGAHVIPDGSARVPLGGVPDGAAANVPIEHYTFRHISPHEWVRQHPKKITGCISGVMALISCLMFNTHHLYFMSKQGAQRPNSRYTTGATDSEGHTHETYHEDRDIGLLAARQGHSLHLDTGILSSLYHADRTEDGSSYSSEWVASFDTAHVVECLPSADYDSTRSPATCMHRLTTSAFMQASLLSYVRCRSGSLKTAEASMKCLGL